MLWANTSGMAYSHGALTRMLHKKKETGSNKVTDIFGI